MVNNLAIAQQAIGIAEKGNCYVGTKRNLLFERKV